MRESKQSVKKIQFAIPSAHDLDETQLDKNCPILLETTMKTRLMSTVTEAIQVIRRLTLITNVRTS